MYVYVRILGSRGKKVCRETIHATRSFEGIVFHLDPRHAYVFLINPQSYIKTSSSFILLGRVYSEIMTHIFQRWTLIEAPTATDSGSDRLPKITLIVCPKEARPATIVVILGSTAFMII